MPCKCGFPMRSALRVISASHFHAGEDLHFVGVVAGLGGTTEQMHFSAA